MSLTLLIVIIYLVLGASLTSGLLVYNHQHGVDFRDVGFLRVLWVCLLAIVLWPYVLWVFCRDKETSDYPVTETYRKANDPWDPADHHRHLHYDIVDPKSKDQT